MVGAFGVIFDDFFDAAFAGIKQTLNNSNIHNVVVQKCKIRFMLLNPFFESLPIVFFDYSNLANGCQWKGVLYCLFFIFQRLKNKMQ